MMEIDRTDRLSDRKNGVMIIIAWLLIVLTTPVSVAAGVVSPVADVAPACNQADLSRTL